LALTAFASNYFSLTIRNPSPASAILIIWTTGIFHLAIIEPQIEAVAQQIADTGGKRRTAVWTLFPDKPFKLAYCEDPFGNIIELYTHSTEQIWSNR
jgi:catechol-2,3-dioxygenase